jgi:hypothetical protein
MWTLMNICKDKKIKFIWNQILEPFPSPHFWRTRLLKVGRDEGWDINVNLQAWEELKSTLRWSLSDQFFSETVLKSPYAKFLVKHKKYFYGFSWSNSSPWDACGLDSHKEKVVYPETKPNRKEEVDFHPNKLGQEEIAEEMWKEYGNYLVKN